MIFELIGDDGSIKFLPHDPLSAAGLYRSGFCGRLWAVGSVTQLRSWITTKLNGDNDTGTRLMLMLVD